jgi:hypothetical protein
MLSISFCLVWVPAMASGTLDRARRRRGRERDLAEIEALAVAVSNMLWRPLGLAHYTLDCVKTCNPQKKMFSVWIIT